MDYPTIDNKEKLEITSIPGVRFKKTPVLYYWFEEKGFYNKDSWFAFLENHDYFLFTGYTKEGLFGNIDAMFRDTYQDLISHEQLSQTKEYNLNVLSEYFDCNFKSIEKKVLPLYYNDIINGYKTFEFRKNDEDYHTGDTLILKEWDGNKYTGNETKCAITYIITGKELNNIYPNCIDDDYCILGIERIYY